MEARKNSFLSSERYFLALTIMALLPQCRATNSTNNSGSFVLDTGTPLTTETAITSTRPLDSGKSFRLGYGYDKMSGERRPTCLDGTKFELQGRNIRTTVSDFQLVASKEDLARNLNIEVNAEASGSYGTVTGSASTKTQIMKNANFSSRSIIGILSFVHRAQEIAIESNYQVLTDDNLLSLAADPAAFRLRCGDAYTRSVTTGAGMYILVELKSRSSEITDHVTTASSVKVAFNNMFSGSAGNSVNKEVKETLANFETSLSCYSVGISTDACAGAFTAVNAEDINGLAMYINEAKKSMNTSINANTNLLVAIDEVFDDYPKPIEQINVPRKEIFFDYTERLQVLKDLLEKEMQSNSSCNLSATPSCNELRRRFAEQIKYCARQEFWADCHPESIDVSKVLAESTPGGIGKVTFYEHHRNGVTGGRNLVIDFDKQANAAVTFAHGKIYNFGDYRFEDIATGFTSTLGKTWQMRLFENRDGGGICYLINGASTGVVNLGRFNDKASSFRLERVGDYPQSCEF